MDAAETAPRPAERRTNGDTVHLGHYGGLSRLSCMTPTPRPGRDLKRTTPYRLGYVYPARPRRRGGTRPHSGSGAQQGRTPARDYPGNPRHNQVRQGAPWASSCCHACTARASSKEAYFEALAMMPATPHRRSAKEEMDTRRPFSHSARHRQTMALGVAGRPFAHRVDNFAHCIRMLQCAAQPQSTAPSTPTQFRYSA